MFPIFKKILLAIFHLVQREMSGISMTTRRHHYALAFDHPTSQSGPGAA